MTEVKVQHNRCPVCGAQSQVEVGANTIIYKAETIDPCVLLRAADACRTVARSIAGGTATTVTVQQLVADEEELRKLAYRLRGQRP